MKKTIYLLIALLTLSLCLVSCGSLKLWDHTMKITLEPYDNHRVFFPMRYLMK